MDMIITEPKWKKWVVETTSPIFTPQLCQELVDLSKTLKKEKGKIVGREVKELRESTIGWHTDTAIDMSDEPPVRKISMTVLLNDPSEFEGGDLEIANLTMKPMKQGHAAIFASFLQHQVKPVTKGVRRSLVMWFGGKPFK